MIRALICYFKGHKWGASGRYYTGSDSDGEPLYEYWKDCERCGQTDYNAKDDVL